MVPETWNLIALDEATHWSSGGTPSMSKPSYWGGDIPWISASSMLGNSYGASSKHITQDGLKAGSKLAKKESLLLLVRGSMLWKKIPIGITNKNVAFNQDLKCITAKEELIPKFLLYWFISNENKLRHMVTGTGIGAGKLDTKDLKALKIAIPPIHEQKKIVRTLSTWDKAIEIVEKLIKNSEAQKKALMQQLLTCKQRLSGFDEKWSTVELSKLFHFKKGKGLSKGDIDNSGKYKCVLYGELYTKYSEIIHTVESKTDINNGFSSIAGDVLIPCSTTTSGIDLANATCLQESDVLLGGDITVLRPINETIDPEFVAYLLTHIKKHEIARLAQGITIIHLYGRDLCKISITFPKVDEQEKIINIIKNSDKAIEFLNLQLDQFKSEKKALMQQLLTGKKRVKVN